MLTDSFDVLCKQVELEGVGVRIKSIINPQACVYMHNHHCWGVTHGYQYRPIYRDIDPSIATNRHFKRCHFKPDECVEIAKTAVYDNVMLRYADALKESVNKKMATTFKGLVI